MIMLIFFLFLHENISLGYSFKTPQQGTFNEYHNMLQVNSISPSKQTCTYSLEVPF